MIKQIQQNRMYALPNAAHVEQMTQVLQIVSEAKAQELKLVDQRKTLAELFNQEDNVFKLNQAYELTPEIQAADKARDDMFSFIMGIIRTNTSNFETNKKEAALKLDYLTKAYRGAGTKTFVEESALITHMVQDLQDPANTTAVSTLDLTQAVVKLKEANEQFQQVYVSRFDETEQRKAMDNMKTIRKKVDEAYYILTNAINAAYLYHEQVLKNASQALLYAEMIDRINAIIDMIEQMQSLSGKRKDKEEEKKE